MKTRTSEGPDETAVEMFKAMEAPARKEILKILNKWWAEER